MGAILRKERWGRGGVVFRVGVMGFGLCVTGLCVKPVVQRMTSPDSNRRRIGRFMVVKL